MSADIVSLRLVRKAKARAEKEAQAAENRAKFGRTKVEKQKSAAEAALANRKLDSLKRDDVP